MIVTLALVLIGLLVIFMFRKFIGFIVLAAKDSSVQMSRRQEL